MAEPLQKYVSAEWIHDEVFNTYTIKATGDNGEIYWLGSDKSDVPPWPEYLTEGGTISGTPPPAPKEA